MNISRGGQLLSGVSQIQFERDHRACTTPMLRKLFRPAKITHWTILEKEVVDEIIFRTLKTRNRLLLELMARGRMGVRRRQHRVSKSEPGRPHRFTNSDKRGHFRRYASPLTSARRIVWPFGVPNWAKAQWSQYLLVFLTSGCGR
jgi:hypothetical protein